MHERVFAVRGLGDLELAVLHGEPRPAGAELRRARRDESPSAELVVAAEVAGDRLFELAGKLVAAAALGFIQFQKCR